MRPHLRIVKSEDEEKKLAQLQYEVAYKDYLHLVIQSLCFKKYKTYLGLISISRKYKEDKNLNQFIIKVTAHRYLYNLGSPSSLAQKRVSEALRFIKAQSSFPVIDEKQIEYRNLVSRLFLVAVVFDKRVEQSQLIEIAARLNKIPNPIWFLHAIEPLKKLLELENVDI